VSLISESYRQQNTKLHEGQKYGVSGHKRLHEVLSLAELLDTRDILDYGCGQRSLETVLGFPIKNYDPCVPGLDSAPEPAILVICNEVLEHVEPDYLDNVLDDIQRVTLRANYLIIPTAPAKKSLPDGRNAHLIQEGVNWWMPKILARFKLRSFKLGGTKLHFICEKL